MDVIVFVWVRSVDSYAPFGSSGSFGCFLPIPVGHTVRCCSISVRPGDRRHRLVSFYPLPCALVVEGYVRFIPVRPGRRVHSCAFRRFPYALGVVGSFLSVPEGRRGRSVTFGPYPRAIEFLVSLPCSLDVIVFVLVLSASFRAPWGIG